MNIIKNNDQVPSMALPSRQGNTRFFNSAFVFIDGSNLYHNVKAMQMRPSQIDFNKLSKHVCNKFKCNHKKTIYYNSIPNINDGKNTYYDYMKFIDNLRKIPNFEVKLRKLQSNKKKGEKFYRKEKGVDTLLGIDMLNMSILKKKCSCCILISGDADFIPVMDLMKENNIKAVSASVPNGYSYNLRSKHPYLIINRKEIKKCLK